MPSRADSQDKTRRAARAFTLLTGLILFLSACNTLGEQELGVAAKPPVQSDDLGANVTIFTPDMPVNEIEAKFDAITAAQFTNEFGPRRDAIMFMPGTYGTPENPLNVQVGYNTEVLGLGASPTDVVVNGTINVFNRCLENNETDNCIALTNFWRSMSNLTINPTGVVDEILGQANPNIGCTTNTQFWAVSQAAPLRRVNVNGAFSFMDYCSAGPNFASGGFMADSKATATIVNGSQQQWYTRNSVIGGWSNAVWSAVFSGVVGAPVETFPKPNPYTVLKTTPVSREKPYLFVDNAGTWNVRVPSTQFNSRGITWAEGLTPGRTIPITEFFIAKPGTSVQEINNNLARGKHLLVTPGVYDIDKTIAIKRADTVVLGIGYATFVARNGVTPLNIADVPGVVIAGLMVEAGPQMSENLVVVGKKNGNNGSKARAMVTNPITLSDVFLRVGGPHIAKVDVALKINSDNVLIDHTWVWRADHGQEGLPKDTVTRFDGDTNNNGRYDDDARWEQIIGNYGVVVDGDNVTATGLFVEHFQKNNTLWNGEGGTTIFYQNELPYDPPTQEAWNEGNGGDGLGWAGYKVADDVKTHNLYGGGVYVYNQNNPSIHTTNGFEVPNTPGIDLYHIFTVNLSAGTIDHVVNGIGGQVDNSNTGSPSYVVSYP